MNKRDGQDLEQVLWELTELVGLIVEQYGTLHLYRGYVEKIKIDLRERRLRGMKPPIKYYLKNGHSGCQCGDCLTIEEPNE